MDWGRMTEDEVLDVLREGVKELTVEKVMVLLDDVLSVEDDEERNDLIDHVQDYVLERDNGAG